MPDSPPSLWPLQVRVLRLVRRGVPAAAGFALAGGAALVVHGVVDRPTEDLDLFTTEPRDVPLAVAALRQALAADGMQEEVVRSGSSFTRLLVTEPDSGASTVVDLAWGARLHDPEESPFGPVLSLRELAADKVLALFRSRRGA